MTRVFWLHKEMILQQRGYMQRELIAEDLAFLIEYIPVFYPEALELIVYLFER